ncbi:RimK family alpha-L-glutamate ligase [Streptomyces sp. NPDC057877]|uniref:ATP-grasp domain-containing protein n=1 Tax=Streptomyces sp. NPDC057877 TaxID=3346269 RepID=UPI003697E812
MPLPFPRIALVTCRPGPRVSVDRDLPVLVEALEAAGAEARAVVWDQPGVEWEGFDLALIRSTWDYSWRAEEFLTWAEACGKATRLVNPVGVVRWNADKRYLGELAGAGVPTVPTRYVAPGEDVLELPSDGEFVVKPTSGAGARFAARYTPGERDIAVRHIRRMHAEGFTAMVQPYMWGIDARGERALQFFGGRLLHASRKRAVLAPGVAYDERKVAHPGLEAWEPTETELSVAGRALGAVPGGAEQLTYARVDLVDGEDGEPRLMELELVEPNLFLSLHPGSTARVVEAVLGAAASWA